MGAVAAALSLLLAACVAIPAQEMSDARMAIAAAEAVNAGQASPRTMKASRDLLEQADVALRHGEHEQARQSAGAARVNAIEARRSAVLIANAQNAIAKVGESPKAQTLLDAAREAALAGEDQRAQKLALRAREAVGG